MGRRVPQRGEIGCAECALKPRDIIACPICDIVACRECFEFWHPDCIDALLEGLPHA